MKYIFSCMSFLYKFFCTSFVFVAMTAYGQNYNTNVNQNVNSNTIVINNQPVIKEREYIIKYRPNPVPSRRARKLSAPVCLLGYLWVYPEDLGNYKSGPNNIINQVNRQGRYGRNNWRIPNDEELCLMENYADNCGLGSGIYLSTSHGNGILRLVSTGPTIEEQRRTQAELNARLQAEAIAEQWRREAEQAELQRRREAAAAALAASEQREYMRRVENQNALIENGSAVLCNGLLWSTLNKGARTIYEKGVVYSNVKSDGEWRLPTESEFKTIIKQSTKQSGSFLHSSGLVIPFGAYAVKTNNNSYGYILLPEMMVNNGGMSTFIRFVQDKIW